MNRKLKIISIIIVLIALVTFGLWFLARNRAVKNNITPPTFKEFLGLGVSTKPQPGGDVDNTLSSDFVNPNDVVSDQPNTTVPIRNIPISTSIFTNSGFNPVNSGSGSSGSPGSPGNSGNSGSSGSSGSTGGGGGGGSGSGGAGGGGPIIIGGGGIIIPPPADPNPAECSAADLNINFTPEEINKLNALKNRFMVIAETLNTDANVATEVANHDTFKSKSIKFTELKDYCVNSLVYKNSKPTPNVSMTGSWGGTGNVGGIGSGGGSVVRQPYGSIIPGPNGNTINYRVPTPFWHEPTKDNQAFIHQGNNWMGVFTDTDPTFAERAIEHALRINLW